MRITEKLTTGFVIAAAVTVSVITPAHAAGETSNSAQLMRCDPELRPLLSGEDGKICDGIKWP